MDHEENDDYQQFLLYSPVHDALKISTGVKMKIHHLGNIKHGIRNAAEITETLEYSWLNPLPHNPDFYRP